MNQTKSHNPNSITLGSAKIEITKSPVIILTDGGVKTWQLADLEDLGLARGIKITPVSTKAESKADNGTVPIKGKYDRKVNVDFSLLERHIPILAKVMDGLVKIKITAGVAAPQTNAYPAGSVAKAVPVMFKKFNFDGAKPTAIVLKHGATVLANGTDYEIIEYAGVWYFVIVTTSPAFDDAQVLTVEYTVTPPVSYRMSQGSSGIGTPLGMKLTNKRQADNGEVIERTWEYPYGFYNGEDTINFKSQADADAVAEVPMSFEFSPHPDMVDDAQLEGESLCREDQEVA